MKSLTSSFVDCPACFSGRIDGVSWHRHVPLPQNRKLWHRYPEEINHRYRNDCMRRIGVPSANGNGAPGDDISIIGDGPSVWTKFIAETLLPTSQGKFRLRGYRHTIDGGTTFTEPSAIINGAVEGQEGVVVRVHDACFTSEVLGSLKCDCREQLHLAMEYIQANPPGMVIYLQQEGRGIGLANKIAAYSLQEKGLDTVDANRALGLPDDCREYSAVRHILRELGIKSIRLMTNNPRKISELNNLGIPIVDRMPCIVRSTEHNAGYLRVKESRMEHMLTENEEKLEGQFCYWNHEGEPSSAGIPMETTATVAVGATYRRRRNMNGVLPKEEE